MFEFDNSTLKKEAVEPVSVTDNVEETIEMDEDNNEVQDEHLKVEQGTEWFHKLGLSQEEIEVLENIDYSEPEVTKGASGTVKIHGDCVSTTCTYTETTYSCPYTQ